LIVIANTEGRVGVIEAMRVLKAGGSVVDAVEAGVRIVEADPDNHAVGYSGYPNILGQVEVDAGIMEGHTLTAGAVGALRGYVYAISIARQVMEKLPHVFLAGQGAERFAHEMGFNSCDLLTDYTRRYWEERLEMEMTSESLRQLSAQRDLWRRLEITADPDRIKGTINIIARDDQGHLCVGTSTSGWFLKYPGRVGDSPIIGAGLYADDRYGAAACTGMGEMSMRACTARSIILYLKIGYSLEEAGRQAMQDFNDLGGNYLDEVSFVAIDAEGHHVGFSTMPEQSYLYMRETMDGPEEKLRSYVPVKKCWGKVPR
jgi:beta-aspartyl-peptidase (threonine type)